MGEKPFYFKEGTGKVSVDNIVIGGLKASSTHKYFYYDGETKDAPTKARFEAGDVKFKNVKFVDVADGQKWMTELASHITESATATGAGNGTAKPSWLPDALNKVNANTNVLN